MRCGSHGDENHEQVDVHGGIGQPGKPLQGADLPEEEACKSPHQAADGVTELEFGGFGERLAVRDDDSADVAHQLDSLEDIGEVAEPRSIQAVAQVAKGARRKLI